MLSLSFASGTKKHSPSPLLKRLSGAERRGYQTDRGVSIRLSPPPPCGASPRIPRHWRRLPWMVPPGWGGFAVSISQHLETSAHVASAFRPEVYRSQSYCRTYPACAECDAAGAQCHAALTLAQIAGPLTWLIFSITASTEHVTSGGDPGVDRPLPSGYEGRPAA